MGAAEIISQSMLQVKDIYGNPRWPTWYIGGAEEIAFKLEVGRSTGYVRGEASFPNQRHFLVVQVDRSSKIGYKLETRPPIKVVLVGEEARDFEHKGHTFHVYKYLNRLQHGIPR